MPSLSDLHFDLTGWTPEKQSESESHWLNAAGDVLSLHFFSLPPDLPVPLDDLAGLRASYRDGMRKAGGGIVEVDTLSLAGLRAVRTLFKFPQNPQGMAYVGSLTLPFAEFSYVLRVQCPERGTTDLRDSAVSRARRYLAHLERTLQVSPALLQARPFTNPSASQARAPQANAPQAGALELLPDPRRHHYEFAHRAVPYLFLKDPEKFLGAMHQGGVAFLERLWGAVAKDIPAQEVLSPEGLGVAFQADNDSIVAVLSLPRVRAEVEALLVGCHYWTSPPPRQPALARARYFTLELGVREDGTLRTVLGEWEIPWRHSNYGEGPSPSPENFIAAIRDEVQRPK